MENKQWWKEAVVYEIMTKSFYDTNKDGWGDLDGIIKKLDYLEYLGINCIWLTPVQQSGGVDNGYDISDYYNIEESYGGNKALVKFIRECKKRNIKVMFDMVMSHTSIKHKWFKEAQKSMDNKYRDYYIWSDKKIKIIQNSYGAPCVYEEDPWTFCPITNQYYFHMFATEMPDLNYANIEVQKEFVKIMKYYLDIGIEGFRFDVVDMIGKDVKRGIITEGDNLWVLLEELAKNGWNNDYDNIFTVAEAACASLDNIEKIASLSGNSFSMSFQLGAQYTNAHGPNGKYLPSEFDVSKVKNILYDWQMRGNQVTWNSILTNNHDTGRHLDRWFDNNKLLNDDQYRIDAAKISAISFFMMKGTPFIYQGEEIGMVNMRTNDISDYIDAEARGKYKQFVINQKSMTDKQFLEGLYKAGRDGAKVPMQWDDSTNAGFSEADKTWLPINNDYKRFNVKKQINDKDSILSLYRQMIMYRTKKTEVGKILLNGKFNFTQTQGDIFDYTLEFNNKKIRVVTNWSTNTEYKIENIGEVIIDTDKENKNIVMPMKAKVFLI